jgi:steroid 5-alpha reductase family enzyme
LGSFLFVRILQDGGDGRFDDIKPRFARFLATWTLQGLWVFLTLCAALAAITSRYAVPVGWIAALGAAVWICGFAMEVIADRQKREFRKNRAATEGGAEFITTGLWAWSRHPNYFGEIVLWIGIAIIAAPALNGWQWVTMISPVFVTLLLTKVSGVPLLEARADAKWAGDADYEAYKRNTPVLIPRPPKK